MSIPALLLVDDEEEILESLKHDLFDWSGEKGLEILTASSAEKAIEIASGEQWELVIMITDQRMPGMSGDKCIEKITSIQPDIVSIVLTGHMSISDMVKLLNSKTFAYLLKPWDRDNLTIELDKAYKYYLSQKTQRLARQRIEQELKLGAQFQKALQQNLPIPQNETIDFSVSTHAASDLDFSGDYYDIILLENNRYLVLVGDVAGHGLNTAFIGGILKAIIYPEFVSPYREGNFSPARFLNDLNARLLEIMENLPDVLVSFSVALVDTSTHTLIYSSAGFPPAVVVRRGEVLPLRNKQMPLGATDRIEFERYELSLEPDDIGIFYTDGLHPSGNNATHFREEDLFSLFAQHFTPKESHDESHKQVIEGVKELLDRKEFEDDVTLGSFHLKR